MFNQVIIPILILLANVVSTVVIVQFVLSLLLAFNVVSYRQPLVSSLMQALSAIVDPILRPIRRNMPDTGAIDFSPMVFLILIQIVIIIANYIGNYVP